MKSQSADEQRHTNQILSQHKHKHNTKLGNEFSLDEQRNNEELKKGEEKKADWKKKKQTHHIPSIRQALAYIINIITWGGFEVFRCEPIKCRNYVKWTIGNVVIG